jgi:hypothetical protein
MQNIHKDTAQRVAHARGACKVQLVACMLSTLVPSATEHKQSIASILQSHEQCIPAQPASESLHCDAKSGAACAAASNKRFITLTFCAITPARQTMMLVRT